MLCPFLPLGCGVICPLDCRFMIDHWIPLKNWTINFKLIYLLNLSLQSFHILVLHSFVLFCTVCVVVICWVFHHHLFEEQHCLFASYHCMRSPEYVQKMCTNSHTASSRIKELSSIRRQLTVILESQHELQTSLEHVGGTWHCTKDKTYYGFIFKIILNNFTWIFTVDDVTVLWCHQQQCFLVGEAVKPKSSHSASRFQISYAPTLFPTQAEHFRRAPN